MSQFKKNIQKALWSLVTFGPIAFAFKSLKALTKSRSLSYLVDVNYQYQKWRKKHKDLNTPRSSYNGLFSIIIPVWNPREDDLKKAVDSIFAQTYENWELCLSDDASDQPYVKKLLLDYQAKDKRIRVNFRKRRGQIAENTNSALALAKGDFAIFMDNDDFIEPDALMEFAHVLKKNPDTDMIYSDEDIVESGRHLFPWFKPDFSPDTLLSTMYPTHLSAYRLSLIKKVGAMEKGSEGSQDYNLLLRFSEKSDKIVHIPKILYHWQIVPGSSTAGNLSNKSYAVVNAKQALVKTIKRRKLDAKVVGDSYPFRMQYKIQGNPTITTITWSEKDTAQSLNSVGLKTKGDYILFMHESFRPLNEGWLESLIEHAQRKEIAVAGGKVVFADDTLKSAGVVIGIKGTAASSFYRIPKDSVHFFNFVNTIRNVSALSLDCFIVRSEVFRKLGGFDSKNYSKSLFDADFCLRALEKGYRNIYTPFCEVEVKSSESASGKEDSQKFKLKWEKYILHDPYYNKNLSKNKRNYSLNLD